MKKIKHFQNLTTLGLDLVCVESCLLFRALEYHVHVVHLFVWLVLECVVLECVVWFWSVVVVFEADTHTQKDVP